MHIRVYIDIHVYNRYCTTIKLIPEADSGLRTCVTSIKTKLYMNNC